MNRLESVSLCVLLCSSTYGCGGGSGGDGVGGTTNPPPPTNGSPFALFPGADGQSLGPNAIAVQH